MREDLRGETEVPQILPVFPLPNTVFFPHTLLPLHIFEPRYRAMVRDVAAGHGLIVISRMVGEGFENLGTVGRVDVLKPLEDGRFNLVLEGLHRVSMVEVPCDTPYRQVRIEPRPERPGTDDPAVIEKSKLELLATLSIILSVAQVDVPAVLNQDQPFEVVVNKACDVLPVEASVRQRLLATGDLIERHRMVSDLLDAVIESIAQLGPAGQDGGSAPN
jgi:Lon protease-like protein